MSLTVYLRWMGLSFFLGQFRFSHWLTIIGTSYIAIATSTFVVLKRVYPQKTKGLYRFHIFGNLLLFSLISIHFASQLGRPAANFPELGTGLAMYVAMTLQVASGFTQRFMSVNRHLKINKFVHASLIVVFFGVILFHVLHGLGIT
jgi:heme A synthase